MMESKYDEKSVKYGMILALSNVNQIMNNAVVDGEIRYEKIQKVFFQLGKYTNDAIIQLRKELEEVNKNES